MDIRLYNRTNSYDSYMLSSELTSRAKTDDYVASDLEIYGNKVVKFLLTYKGTDALDPEYGGIALHYGQISKQFIPRLTMELINDIARCKTYLRKGESNLIEKILDLRLIDIKYEPLISPDRVDIFIEIITNKNRRALVAVQNKQV